MYSLQSHAAGTPQPLRSPARCLHCPCRIDGICAAPDGEAGQAPLRDGTTRRLRRGDTLVWAGEPAQDIANVVSGAFKLVALSSEGQERTVGLLLPGDFIGDPLGRSNAFTAVALTDATVCLIAQSAIARLLDQSPAFGTIFLKRAVTDLDQARRWVLMIGGRRAGARVASLLTMLAAQTLSPRDRVTIPFSRGDMAELLGLTLETVSRRLHQLVRTGAIALPDRRGFIVLDPDRLAMEAA